VAANNAHLRQADDKWQVEGNPSEGALLAVARKAGLATDKLRAELKRFAEVPFSSKRKFMATLHPQPGQAQRIAYVKGAPDRLLLYSSQVLINGESETLSEQRKRELEQVIDELAAQGFRVLAGAYREFPAEKEQLQPEDVQEQLTLVGFWAIIDPPRSESAAAVTEAREAGIRPVMITGDHVITASAIARQVGITRQNMALSGRDVEQMAKPELAKAALDIGVFARVAPADKLKILQALKERGEIVAMTGDGVNDAPALKNADIGIAMGITGTEVAKEAADMILTDDNFATIVAAIEEGRVIYSNLQRVVFYLLSTNLGEVITFIGALVLGLDLPLTAIMVLWINLVTDGAGTVPLGLEPRHRDVLKAAPRAPGEPILTKGLLFRMFCLTPLMALGTLGLFWYELAAGSLRHAQTIAFTTLAAFQWFQAFNARSAEQSVFAIGPAGNRWLLLGVGTAVLLQLAVIYIPMGQLFFATVPLDWLDWVWIILVSSTVWIVDEILKRTCVYHIFNRRS
jgi:Ca2+-transporting ATPase